MASCCFRLKPQVPVAEKQVQGGVGRASRSICQASGTRTHCPPGPLRANGLYPPGPTRPLRANVSRHYRHRCHRCLSGRPPEKAPPDCSGKAPALLASLRVPGSAPPCQQPPWLRACHPEAAWHKCVPTAEVAGNNRCLSRWLVLGTGGPSHRQRTLCGAWVFVGWSLMSRHVPLGPRQARAAGQVSRAAFLQPCQPRPQPGPGAFPKEQSQHPALPPRRGAGRTAPSPRGPGRGCWPKGRVGSAHPHVWDS